MERLKSRNLQGVNRCNFRRSRKLQLETGKRTENVYDKASLIKDIIKEGLRHRERCDEKTIREKLETGFAKLEYPTQQTAWEHLEDAFRQINRYLNCESRSSEFVTAKTVVPFDLCEVEVLPDLIFRGVREFERTFVNQKGKKEKCRTLEPYIEVVKLRCGLPNVTQTGKKKDTGANQCLELYTMLLYGRTLIRKSDINIHVGASYYFLRKKDDSKAFDEKFFNQKNAGNVVTLWERHHAAFSPEAEEMDARFLPQFQDFLEGETICDRKTCEKCDFYEVCNFTKPPHYVEKKKKARPIADLVLTDTQEAAIGFRKGIARINAGAGAGKTLVSALRVAFMLDEGVKPEAICMLTFTSTGAQEMRERVRLYAEDMGCPADIDRLTSTTFHSFGNDIIAKNYELFGFTKPPRLIDDIERFSIIAGLLGSYTVHGLDYKNFKMNLPYIKGALHTAAMAFDVIKRERLSRGDEEKLRQRMEAARYTVTDRTGLTELLDLYLEYDSILTERNLIEYADQELLILDLLQKNPFYFEDYGFQHIIVDEFQDTNELQFEILKCLIDTPAFESFMVVGDDSQSIFSFRGSTPEFIINFFDRLKEKGEDFYLLENHRSTPEIIDFANQVNSQNVNRVMKSLAATRAHGAPVTVKQFWKKEDEISCILKQIVKKHGEGTAYEEMAYLASTREELMKMGTACTEAGIPWVMLNPEPMLDNSRVLAAIALVRFMKDPTATKDAFVYLNAASKNTLLDRTDGEIQTRMEQLKETVLQLQSRNDLFLFQQMVEALKDEDEIFDLFLKSLYLRSNLEEMMKYCLDYDQYGEGQCARREKNYPGVVLTTAHSSKGMEWPIVFNAISHYHTKGLTREEVEEKRRLLFVSSTRARDELYLTGQSVAYGAKGKRVFNQFLMECHEILGEPFSFENPYEKTKSAGTRVS